MRKLALASTLILFGCTSGADAGNGDNGKKFTSSEATLMDFEFDGELLSDSVYSDSSAKSVIEDQLIYSMGQLNDHKSVARLDRIELSNIVLADAPDDKKHVTYHAKLPVAWESKTNLPSAYPLVFPKDLSYAAMQTWFDAIKDSCVDDGAHDVELGNFWYDYRPAASACKLPEGSTVTSQATARRSELNTNGKYPEFDKVWEDGALKVVAIFGKYEDGTTTDSDVGIAGYNRFVSAVQTELAGLVVNTTPATFPDSPGVASPDIEFHAVLDDTHTIDVTALLVDNVRTAGKAFDDRYEALSTDADVIMYNGHAGLGSNVRALASKGKFVAGKYVIIFMNGCDTFAYVDGSLAETRAQLNPDDPTGTKYMEIVTNAMPSYFSSMPTASMALVKGLRAWNAPTTYQQMFDNIDSEQVVLVTGEEDNTYQP